MHFTDIIVNKKLATDIIYHIVTIRNLYENFTSATTHLLNNYSHLNIVYPYQNNNWGVRKRLVSGVCSSNSGVKYRDIKKMTKVYIDGKKWGSMYKLDRDAVIKYLRGKNL